MPFTVIDIIFCLILLVLCIRAAVVGFIKEIFGIGSFIVSGYCAFLLTPKLKPFLQDSMNETIAVVLSFALIFIVVFLILKIIQLALQKIFSGSILVSLDHCLGFGFGIFEGFFCIYLIFFIMNVLKAWIDTQSILSASYFYKLLSKLIELPI